MVTNPDLATTLALYGEVLRVPKDAVIFEPGECADGAYIVRSGMVNVVLLDRNQVPVWSRTLSEYGILGLPAAIGKHPHSLRAVAGDNTEMIFLSEETLSHILLDNPDLSTQLLRVMSEELHDLRKKVAMLNGLSKPRTMRDPHDEHL